jgi:UDP-N-acetyl-D-galactosamine dehydrogenase
MEETVGIIGLGYVGLPLAVAFGQVADRVGYDLSVGKFESYRRHVDPTGEVGSNELRAATRLAVTNDPRDLSRASIFIVAVPTPVDAARQPDFGPLLAACGSLGPHLAKGATVAIKSTVYPSATEEICIPALEKSTGEKCERDFFVGYSPERINPGDEAHTLAKIVKVVAGDTLETLARVAELCAIVVEAGIQRAPLIAVAEAAKVLAAVRTKWKFLNFRPGLVGGHCIDVGPYYLTHKAEKLGLHPQVILPGRHINDADIRNSKVVDVKGIVDRAKLEKRAIPHWRL